jgi:hypothetical protein
MADGNPQFTPDTVMQIRMTAKEELAAMSKRHQEEAAPLTERLRLCDAWLLDYLNREGLDNAKTPHGLAYKSSIMSATVDPEGGWDALLGHIFQHAMGRVLDALEQGTPEDEAMSKFLASPELALLNRAVNKTAVKEALEQGVTVPGVKVSHILQLNVRKA